MSAVKQYYFSAVTRRNRMRNLQPMITATGQRIVFPFYHVVSDNQLPHIRNLYAYRNASAFEADLDFLLKNFEPLSADRFVKNEYDAGKNYFLLSFDDGLREMFDVVVPILNRKGVPAVFFVNSAFVDNADIFFRYLVSLIIEATSQQGNKRIADFILDQKKLRISNLKQYLLSLNYKDRNWLKEIADAAEVNWKQFLEKEKPYLSLDQLQSLSAMGFSIGAHSHDHPLYEQIPLQEQLDQTRKSLTFVQEHFHQPFNYFAFPFTDHGVGESFYNEIFSGPEHPVHLSFGTAGLAAVKGRRVQRIPMELGNYTAEEIIKNEFSWYRLKQKLGRA